MPSAVRTRSTPNLPAVLLVHGAWHGAWCWEATIPFLQAQTEVHAIDLPSSRGDASIGLDDDVAAVRNAIDTMGGPVIVVGHSSGGIPVTVAAAEHDSVVHLVYLAAFVPDIGESELSLIGGRLAPWQTVADGLRTAGTDAEPAAAVFYNDLDESAAAAAVARLRPQSMRVVSGTVSAAAWRTTPSTYIHTERDHAFPPVAQEQMAARAGATVRRLDASHSPFLSMPETTASLILAAPAG